MLAMFSRGLVTSIVGTLVWLATVTGHNTVATWLTDPDNMQQVMIILGAVLTLAGGALEGVVRQKEPEPVKETEEVFNPYPGYDWDPLKGWVKTDG